MTSTGRSQLHTGSKCSPRRETVELATKLGLTAYVVLSTGWGDDEGTEILLVTLDKAKADDIESIWADIQKSTHTYKREYMLHPEINPTNISLAKLKDKYGIITWAGRELHVEKHEVK